MKLSELKAIFIVAGHGKTYKKNIFGKVVGENEDNGAVGNGTTERTEVIEIAQESIAMLKKQQDLNNVAIFDIGVNEKLSLEEKIHKINVICQENGFNFTNSLLVSIHVNAGGGTGVESWYYGNSELSMDFGGAIGYEMSNATGLKNRGDKSEYANRHGRLGIVHDTMPLAVLIECGFIDTVHDVNILKDPERDDGFALGITKGILLYIGAKYKTPKKEKPTEFLDVPKDSWYYEAVKKVTDADIMSGKDGRFRPSENVTRAELATVIVRMLEK